jgi:hypothetical protein
MDYQCAGNCSGRKCESIFDAIFENHASCIKKKFSHQVNWNREEAFELDFPRCHHSPIYVAINEKNHEILRLLISLGADVNSSYRFLGLCVDKKDVESMEILLSNGAKIPTGPDDPMYIVTDAYFDYTDNTEEDFEIYQKMVELLRFYESGSQSHYDIKDPGFD